MPYYPSRLSILRRAPNVMVVAIAAACAVVSCASEPASEGSTETDVGRRVEPAAAQRPAPAPGAPVARPVSRLIGEPAPAEAEQIVTLVDAGREPRQLLRYTAERGVRQRIHMKGSGTSEVQIGGRRVYTQDEVATEAWFEVTVVAADADRLECDIRFERAMTTDWEKFQPGRATQMHRSLDRLGEHPYRFVMDRRGFVRLPPLVPPPEVDLDGDRNMAWTLVESAARAVVALPAEPVGIGARWRILEEDRGMLNMVGRASTDVELVARRGQRLELITARTYMVAPQVVDLRADIVSGMSRTQSSVRGPAVVDLGLLQPVDWRSKADFLMDGTWLELSERLPMRVVASGSDFLAPR